MFRTVFRMASTSSEMVGATGRHYLLKELIQERPCLGRVWLATSGQEKFVLKDIPKNIFSGFQENIRPKLRETHFIRLPFDEIPDKRILVYKYLTNDFLSLVKQQIPIQARKQILKASLQGISELHSRDIVHLDIKPDNIMVGYHYVDGELMVNQVQITDLENAAYLPEGRCIKGMLPGNDNWRSPEGHFKGELNKPSDIYSFGAVCLYAMLGYVLYGPDDDFQKHQSRGALPFLIRLQRQVSYFGNQDSVNGLMKHIGDDEVNCQVLGMLWEDRDEEHIPYKPFLEWPEPDDPLFRDIIQQMMELDPAKRITASQALEYPWFAAVNVAGGPPSRSTAP